MSANLQRTVLFADVVGSTALYRRVGDAVAEKLVRRALDRIVAHTERLGGRLVKTIGDCALCEFPTADAAVQVAFELQRNARLIAAQAGEEPVLFRVGLMQGPVVMRDNDIFGDAVNMAARLCEIAKVDQVLTTEATALTLDAELRSTMRLFDKTPVKGVTESLNIVQLLWDRRAATEMFVLPKEFGADSSRLVLKYAGLTIAVASHQVPYTIGREAGCNLRVPSPCASREHARIELRRGKFNLVDESTNGTYVAPEGVAVDKSIYIRREPFTLLGRGTFALGERPESGIEHLLTYEVI